MRAMLLAAVACCAGWAAQPASATLLVDFTDNSLFSPDATEAYAFGSGSITVSIAADGGELVFTGPFDGSETPATPLALDNDGVAALPGDEISAGQRLLVTFSGLVAVTGFYFLDIFAAGGGCTESEVAEVAVGSLILTFAGAEPYGATSGDTGGYLYASTSPMLARSLSFGVAAGCCYALAGIEIAPPSAPEPATAATLALGLAGIGLARRRRLLLTQSRCPGCGTTTPGGESS